jgi:hypothetical protein
MITGDSAGTPAKRSLSQRFQEKFGACHGSLTAISRNHKK